MSRDHFVETDAVTRLGEDDWGAMTEMAREHRLGPLMHWQLTHHHATLAVPDAVKAGFARSFKNAAIRSLTLQRELLRCGAVLSAAAVPHAALKGAYLAFHAYPHPALRPLRDLDLVVPKAQALRAYQVLLDAGYTRAPHAQGDPEACHTLDKHLPPLISPTGRICIELHSRLLSPAPGGTSARSAEDWDFWSRLQRRPIGGTDIPFLAPTDLLLHLILHAVYDHQFDNGPLLITDIAYLLETHEIDWPLFWQLAQTGGWSRGCSLALKLAETHSTMPPPPYPDSVLSENPRLLVDQVAQAALLTLRDWRARKDANLASALGPEATARHRLKVFWARVFPPRSRIAAVYPLKAHTPLVYLGYLPHWYRLVTTRLPEYLASNRRGQAASEAAQLIRMEQWLQAKGTSERLS